MVKWFCCSALRLNNHTTTDESGNNIRYYWLPRNDVLKREYARSWKTTGFNWKGIHICGKHWSCGERKNVGDLPDVPVPDGMLERFNTRYDNAVKLYDKKIKPTGKDRAKLRKRKRSSKSPFAYLNSQKQQKEHAHQADLKPLQNKPRLVPWERNNCRRS